MLILFLRFITRKILCEFYLSDINHIQPHNTILLPVPISYPCISVHKLYVTTDLRIELVLACILIAFVRS